MSRTCVRHMVMSIIKLKSKVRQRESLKNVVVDVEDGDAFSLCVKAGGICAAEPVDHRRDDESGAVHDRTVGQRDILFVKAGLFEEIERIVIFFGQFDVTEFAVRRV